MRLLAVLIGGVLAATAADPVTRTLGTYNAGGNTKTNLLVRGATSRSEIIALAKKLHKEQPQVRLNLFDSQAQVKTFVAWDLHYPDKRYPYPEEWLNKHMTGSILPLAKGRGIVAWLTH